MSSVRTAIGCSIVLIAVGSAGAQSFDFSTPSDDRWHYPFNFNPGTRLTGSVFQAANQTGFNDRDGEVVVRWDTSSLIAPGQGVWAYQIDSIVVTLTNDAGATWIPDLTADEWYTADINVDGFINLDGIPRGEPGDVDGESDDADPGRPIELYGAGFGPTHSAASWNENSAYVGSASIADVARDPFPFMYQDVTGDMLHVEDHAKGLWNDTIALPVFEFTPQPWAYGNPVSYTPGSQTIPFSVEFEIDLNASGGLVREYFRQALNDGFLTVIITSYQDTVQGGSPTEFGSFFMKESVGVFLGAEAPALRVVLSGACSPADITTQGAGTGDPGFGVPDGLVTGADLSFFVNGWVADDLGVADLTTQGAGIGDPGFGVPDGLVTGADLSYFVNLWIIGCP